LRPHGGCTAYPKEAGLPFAAAPEVAGHQDLVIVGDRDRSEVEGLVVQRAGGEAVLDRVWAAVREPLHVRGLDADADLPKLDGAGSTPVARSLATARQLGLFVVA
jgi:hypothetical protein